MTPTDKQRGKEAKIDFINSHLRANSVPFQPYSNHIVDGTGSSPVGGRPKRIERHRWRFVPAQSRTSCKIIAFERSLVIPLFLQFADGHAREVRAGHLDQPWNSLVNGHAGESPTWTRGPRHAPSFAAWIYIDCAGYRLRMFDGACITTCPSAVRQTACGVTCLPNLGALGLQSRNIEPESALLFAIVRICSATHCLDPGCVVCR